MRSLIVSTRHSPLDARLERWGRWLSEEGELTTLFLQQFRRSRGNDLSAWFSFVRSVANAVRSCDVCVLPDPDLHLMYRFIKLVAPGPKYILDVHEDYERTSMIRRKGLRGLVSIALAISRNAYLKAAERGDIVVRAAHEIRVSGSYLLENVNFASARASSVDRSLRDLVYVGDLTEQRGADMVLALAEHLPSFRVHIVGRLSVDELLATRLRVLPNVQLYGELPYSDAAQVIGECGVGLSLLGDHAPYRDAVPTKLFDYAAAGLVMVVTPLPGQSRVVSERQLGIVLDGHRVDSESAMALAEQLQSLDGVERRAISERGRRLYEDRRNTVEHQWSKIRSCLV